MHISNDKEMQDFAKDFLHKSLETTSDHSRVVALHGELGAGKSTFVRAIARELGITEKVTSPTFNIMKTYKLSTSTTKFKDLVHIDAYRLKEERETELLDWQELIADPKNLIFIEWPENIANAIPADAGHLYFKYIDEETRSIKYHPSRG